MLDVWIPLLSGFVGALVGGASSVIVVLIQSRKEERRHLRETAMQLAIKEWDYHASIVKNKGGSLGPMSYYLASAMKILQRIDIKGGNVTAEDLIQAADESRRVLDAMKAADPNNPNLAKPEAN